MGDNGFTGRAQQLEEKAIDTEYREMLEMAGRGGAPGPGYVPREPIEQKYRGRIVPLFEPFERIPDPGAYDAPIRSLKDAMHQLSDGESKDPVGEANIRANPDLAHAHSAGDRLDGWTGAAADSFKTNFLDKFPYISKNQFLLLGVMKGALEADQERWRSVREDINRVLVTTDNGLDDVFSSSQNDLSFACSVAVAVSSIGAIPFAGVGAGVIAAVGAVGVTGSAGIAGQKAFNEPGGSTEQVVKSLENAIKRITEETKKAGGKVAHALAGVHRQVDSARDDFVSPRPALAGMDGGETTGESGLGRVV